GDRGTDGPRRDRAAGGGGRHADRRPVDRHRLERPDQPDVLRRLRLPEAVRVLQAQGHCADAGRPREGAGRGVLRHPGRGRGRRLPPSRARPVGDHGEGRRGPPGHL
ncbi:MAG: ATP-dependent Clp protease adaptor protein ClpS, partial [uncultured Acidimicrobiales bacterium]